MNLQHWHTQSIIAIENKLIQLLNTNSASQLLLESIKYSTLDGGKRIRPLFSLASGLLSSNTTENSLTIGCAIEMIHCFSLIHDDLPIMDNDVLRRGKPTNHVIYGDAVALLAGDALHAMCFEILSSDLIDLDADKKISIIQKTAQSIGVNGMVGGQTIDWLNTGKELSIDELQNMHLLKTGALLKAAIVNGYIAGVDNTPNYLNLIEVIADKIGLLFQIIDDIIDATQSTQTLGKTANKDAAQNKATYVNILGLNKSQELAQKLHQDIIEMLKQLNNSEYLQYLTDIVYYRNK